jgi:hypothetical protein
MGDDDETVDLRTVPLDGGAERGAEPTAPLRSQPPPRTGWDRALRRERSRRRARSLALAGLLIAAAIAVVVVRLALGG